MVEQLLFTTLRYRWRATANTKIPIIVDAADGRIVAERFCEVKKNPRASGQFVGAALSWPPLFRRNGEL